MSPPSTSLSTVGSAGQFHPGVASEVRPDLDHGLAKVAPEKHAELVALARMGAPGTVAARIESDIARSGASAVSGPFRHSPSWLVVVEPLLRIVRSEDLVALTPFVETKVQGKQQSTTFAINIFRKGQSYPEKVGLDRAVLDAALVSLRSRFPWAYLEDGAAMLTRWETGREVCEKESAARRAEARSHDLRG